MCKAFRTFKMQHSSGESLATSSFKQHGFTVSVAMRSGQAASDQWFGRFTWTTHTAGGAAAAGAVGAAARVKAGEAVSRCAAAWPAWWLLQQEPRGPRSRAPPPVLQVAKAAAPQTPPLHTRPSPPHQQQQQQPQQQPPRRTPGPGPTTTSSSSQRATAAAAGPYARLRGRRTSASHCRVVTSIVNSNLAAACLRDVSTVHAAQVSRSGHSRGRGRSLRRRSRRRRRVRHSMIVNEAEPQCQ